MSSSPDDTILPPPRKPIVPSGFDGETVLPSNNTSGIHNPGDVIDNRYTVIREIGRGGMGVVYEVLDALTDDHYAVKRLLPFFASRPEVVKQFWSEGAASMRFTNQSRLFVTTQTVGQDQGLPYIVMELISNPTLRAIMNKTGAGLVLNDALSILKAVAASLAELHSMGYIHRDLKPENIFISEHAGNVTAFLSDFGLTKDGLASTATVMKGAGTERYASPEQKRGLPTTPATDVYAFGVIAYEMLTGELPTGGDRLSDFVVNVPDEFEQLIVSCLSSRIDRRPESGQMLVTRFETNQKVTERIQEAEGGNDTVSDDRYHVYGTINLIGLPEPSEVFIDGCRVSGHRHIVELKTESQLVNLVVNSPEYKPFTRNVRLMPSMTTDVMVTMERLPVYISDDVDDYPCLKKYLDLLCKIPGGTFEMGGNSYEREQPLHKVTVSTYFLGATPVTNDMWDEYCNDVGQTANKSHTVGTGDHPVVNVSWDDIMGAEGYCQWASSIAGINLVLPTEAQFEHAARGNLVGKPFPWGVTFNDDFLWCSVINKRTETAEVNRSHNIYVNSYGLSDLVGNVWEWCLDWYAPYTECDKIDPMGPENPIELSRSIRGGSYIYHYPVGFRCATRNRFNPSRHDRFIGFRIACTIADEFNQKTASFTSSLEELASIEPQTTDLVAER